MLIIIIHVHCRVLHFYTISISRVYLDNNATTPLELDVKEAITSALSKAWGNPSSSHTQGKSHRSGCVEIPKWTQMELNFA